LNNSKEDKKGVWYSKHSGKLKVLTGIILSIIFLYLAGRNVEFRKIPDFIGRVNLFMYGLSLILYIFTLLLKSLQVKVMLSPLGSAKTLGLLTSVSIGYYCNNILPLKAGEIVRSTLIARKNSFSFWSVVSAMVLERSLDIVFILLIAFWVSFMVSLPHPVISSIRGFTVFSLLIFAIFIGIISRSEDTGRMRIFQKIIPVNYRKSFEQWIQKFRNGLMSLKNLRNLFYTLFLGLCIWIANMGVYWLRFKSMDLPCSAGVVGFFMVVVGLGVSIPSAPSYVGVFHFLTVYALSVFGVGKNESFSFAVFSHAIDFVVIAVVGNLALLIEGVSVLNYRKSMTGDIQ